jgi:hypothetical protein
MAEEETAMGAQECVTAAVSYVLGWFLSDVRTVGCRERLGSERNGAREARRGASRLPRILLTAMLRSRNAGMRCSENSTVRDTTSRTEEGGGALSSSSRMRHTGVTRSFPC